MRGDVIILNAYRSLRNQVNRAAVNFKSGSRDWWKHRKKLMGVDVNDMQALADRGKESHN